MTNNNFLPDGYENLKTSSNYWKPSQFKEGETKFRIVCKPIAGWIDWLDKKPIRYKPYERPKTSIVPTKTMKAFWDLYVWDYDRCDLFVLELTQNGIIKKLEMLAVDEDWGDFTTYDIKVKKTGSGIDTAYDVNPVPHKPLLPEIIKALESKPVRLEALYESGDPWRDLVPSQSVFADQPKTQEAKLRLTEAQCAELDSYLVEDVEAVENIKNHFGITSTYDLTPIDFERMVAWLKIRKEKKNGKRGVA